MVDFKTFMMAGALLTASAAVTAAPNVVFILADDLGYGDLGPFFQNSRPAGAMRLTTPQIDRMAEEGMMLTHHYTGAPVCVTARACLMTGRHTGHSPVRDSYFDQPLPTNGLTLPRMLQTAGYRTSCIGKWGLAGSAPTYIGHPLLHGFDEFYGVLLHNQVPNHYPGNDGSVTDGMTPVTTGLTGVYVPDLLIARAKHFIQTQAQNHPTQPFFLYLPLTLPHWHLKHPPSAYPAGSGLSGGLQWPVTATGTPDGYVPPDIAAAVYDHDNNPATAMVAWPDNARRYASMVRRMDEGVGDVLQLLRDLNLATNTLVVISSDNGPDATNGQDPRYFESWGPLDGVKYDLWEGGIREPTIAWWPGHVPAGSMSSEPGAFWDWLPTFAEMAGVAPPARDGVSLLPMLTQEGVPQPRTHLYWEFYIGTSSPIQRIITARKHTTGAVGEMQSIRIGDHTGVRYRIEDEFTPLFLYNVVTDPRQDHNLAGSPAFQPLLREMHLRLRGSRRRVNDLPRTYDGGAAQPVGLPQHPGLNYRTFEGAWPWVPDYRWMTPVSTGIVAGVTTSVRTRDTDIGILFEGYINVPQTADYRFVLRASGGGFLWLHDANVCFYDGPPDGFPREGRIRLEAGAHPFRLHYRNAGEYPSLKLEYAINDGPLTTVPSSAFFRDVTPNLRPMAFPDRVETPMGESVNIQMLANDLDDGIPQALSLVSVGVARHGSVSQSGSSAVYTPLAGFQGSDDFSYVISDGAVQVTGRVEVTVAAVDTGEWWVPFEEGAGIAIQEAGGRVIGHTYGTNPLEPRVIGRIGMAMPFDGYHDAVFITGMTPPLGSSPRTLSAWVRMPANGGGPIVGYGIVQAGQKWVFRIQNEDGVARPGALRVEVENGSIVGTRDLRDNQWHHVACVLPASASPNINQVILYVDGVAETVSASTSRAVNTAASEVIIGSDMHLRWFLGTIDEVRVYHRVLSAEEVQGLARGVTDRMELWRRRYLAPDRYEWSDDADGDGSPNIWELASGEIPFTSELVGVDVQAGRSPSRLSLRCLSDPALVIRAEVSESLLDWSHPLLLLPVSETPDEDAPEFRLLEFEIPPDSRRAYLRFSAEPQP